jgi:hypothetical protein
MALRLLQIASKTSLRWWRLPWKFISNQNNPVEWKAFFAPGTDHNSELCVVRPQITAE